jgi:hypothetical protein
MNKKTDKLQNILEQITSVGEMSEENLGPDAQSLREAWLDFGRLLEAAQPSSDEPGPLSLWEMQQSGPLSRRERVRVRAVFSPRWSRVRRWFYSAVAISAAAVLIGVLTSVPNPILSTNNEPTAAIKTDDSTFLSQDSAERSTADDDPLRDEWLDEQIAQVQWQMLCAGRHKDFALADSIQYRIDRMHNELSQGSL